MRGPHPIPYHSPPKPSPTFLQIPPNHYPKDLPTLARISIPTQNPKTTVPQSIPPPQNPNPEKQLAIRAKPIINNDRTAPAPAAETPQPNPAVPSPAPHQQTDTPNGKTHPGSDPEAESHNRSKQPYHDRPSSNG
jgi:hypothetical protein